MANKTSESRQIKFAKLIHKINQNLNSGQAYDQVLNSVFESLDSVIPYDRMAIALLEGSDDHRRVSVKWVKSKLPIRHLTGTYSAPLRKSSLEKIHKTGEPRILNDLRSYAAQNPGSESTKLILKDGILSSLTCGLKADGESIGFVFFSSKEAGTYREEHVETFLEIAEHLSVLVEHGRLQNFFESNASTSQNLRMVLHDLRSPLSVITSFIDMAKGAEWYSSLDPKGKVIFSILQKNASYMMVLLDELSEVAQLKHRADKITLSPVKLSYFFSEILAHGRHLAERKAIRFNMILDKSLPAVAYFDPQKIYRAIENLLTNAVKYSNRQTLVTLVVRHDGEKIQISVSDQGQGIPDGEIPHLFREFGKTSVRPTEGEMSTGMGLAIVKKIASQHGGKISVTSEIGKGSTFTLSFPMAKRD